MSEPQQLKVIGAGFGRTGTDSTRDALTILGWLGGGAADSWKIERERVRERVREWKRE